MAESTDSKSSDTSEDWVPSEMRAIPRNVKAAETPPPAVADEPEEASPDTAVPDETSGWVPEPLEEPDPDPPPADPATPPAAPAPPVEVGPSAELDRRVGAIEERLDRIEAAAQGFDHALEGNGAALDGLGAAQTKLQTEAARLEAQRGELVERLDALESRLSADIEQLLARGETEERARQAAEDRNAAVLTEFRERLDDQSKRLTEAEAEVRTRAATIERMLETAVTEMGDRVLDAVTRSDAARYDVGVLEEAVAAKFGELSSRLSPASQPDSPPPPGSPGSTALDVASFEQLRDRGLSVTQAARFIAFRKALGRPITADDLDGVAGLTGDLRSRLRTELETPGG